jgi:hypothetical protein
LGTGLIAPFYSALRRIRLGPNGSEPPLTIGCDCGVLRSVSHLTAQRKLELAAEYDFGMRAEIARDVASHYPGGDYFEFGSAGLSTFRNFLTAFDIHCGASFPDVRFYAFDVFGNPDHGCGPPPTERAYFESWRNPIDVAAPMSLLAPYGSLIDRCTLVHGYFQETLGAEFKAKLHAAKRSIGFAFLDCSLPSSYEVVFHFLADILEPRRMFIYLGQYFIDRRIADLYQEFTAAAHQRYKLTSFYMRNAASFGALFCLLP